MVDEQIEKAVCFCSSAENNGCLKECPCCLVEDNSPCDEIDYIIRLKHKINVLEEENDRLQGLIKQNDEAVWEMEEKITKGTAKEILEEISKNLVSNGQYSRYEISIERFEILKQKYGVEIKV